MLAKQAFTLIELLIVAAIIGILAAIAVPNFLNAQVCAKIAKVEGDFQAITTALEMYNLDQNGYLPYPDWGGHTTPRYLNGLSTPISYMSSPDSIYDPFRNRDPDHDGIGKPRYGYFDPRTSPVQWFIHPSSYNGVKLPANCEYSLVAIVPSHVQHIDGGTPAGFTVYQSTNGLSSWGQIYRFGP